MKNIVNFEFIKILLISLLCMVFIASCGKDIAHEDERGQRKGHEWVEVSVADIDGNVFYLACPVRSGGFTGGHNDGCYVKSSK